LELRTSSFGLPLAALARRRSGSDFAPRPSDFPNVPLYEYELCEGDCAACGGKFTLFRPLSAAPLTKCPACKKPVRKVLSTFNSPKRLSISAAKKAGFSVYKRLGKGEYERQ
jgi:putative FmdB family regulatory protein